VPSNPSISRVSDKNTQSILGEEVNILGGHSISYSKQKCVYVHVTYSVRFQRFTTQYTEHCTDEEHAMTSHELERAVILTVDCSRYTASVV
jgi:hypothetical protein